jgi:acetyl-CoA/propionyl-CoA carboxylase biotin carboxyl carrier protein
VNDVRRLRKVLIANRGEIAVRVARACRDAGLASVAVYADSDRDAPHVRIADEAYALGGATPADSYLDAGKVLGAARRAGADAVHPGYGFLSESADFATAVIESGLTWIGPPPPAMRALGDKVAARLVAQRVGAPLVPGTPDPVASAREVAAFAERHGLPVAIKAAHGGGGRGMRVAHRLDEVETLFESAVREATKAFGRGECFVERYLERPRHVETQCLADRAGKVVVVSTRDCSVQRRHQKLVEEGPAPFLTAEQEAWLYKASKAILADVGYVGAGTCEFLVGVDGTLSFLEVNARLQVEHPVSEEVTGIDLVREQLRLAAGEELGYDDPPARGHAIEFRINGEDPGRGFLPAPGTISLWRPPSGPGVRLDSGVTEGSTVDGAFDSLLGKLIVTGPTRRIALQRARRALAEFEVEGLPTVLPFHRRLVDDPAFTGEDGFAVHTRWIEDDFDNQLPPYDANHSAAPPPVRRERITVEVSDKRYEVVIARPPDALTGPPPAPVGPARRPRSRATETAAGGDQVLAPMKGTVVSVAVEEGQTVEVGALVAVVEAMKMEHPVLAHQPGKVVGLTVQAGTVVPAEAPLCSIQLH